MKEHWHHVGSGFVKTRIRFKHQQRLVSIKVCESGMSKSVFLLFILYLLSTYIF